MSEAEVVKDIRDYLSGRENEHPPTVLWFSRLQSGQIHQGNQHIFMCKEGTSDFICLFVGKRKQMTCLFIEAKSTDNKPEPRKGAQTAFRNKYHQRHIDMHYMIAQSANEVRSKINELGYEFIKDIEL